MKKILHSINMQYFFIIIIDKQQKRYFVLKTPYSAQIESIMLHPNKSVYELHTHPDTYKDRLERLDDIKHLRLRGYRYKRRLLNEFLNNYEKGYIKDY